MDSNIALEKQAAVFRKIDKLEPEWLYEMRRNSWEFYNDTPLPARNQHLWKYTTPELFVMPESESLMNMPPSRYFHSNQAHGRIREGYSGTGYNTSDSRTFAELDNELINKGVIFSNLLSAVLENDTVIRRYFGKLIDSQFGKFEALNMALWNSGLFLFIPDNTTIELPFYLHRHPTGKNSILRLLVIIGNNSQATIIDNYACHCENKGAIFNSAVEIFAGESSTVQYANFQNLSPDFNTTITERAIIGKNTNMVSAFLGLGGGKSKVNAGTILNGKGAESRMSGVIYADGKQQFDYHTTHHHRQSESFSNLDFRVVLKDNSKSAYTGLIRIEKDTVNCEAYQENRNLLLDKGTKAESIPELEILTDQVRCTHGATMGPIDPDILFYLQSRGVSHG